MFITTRVKYTHALQLAHVGSTGSVEYGVWQSKRECSNAQASDLAMSNVSVDLM